MPASRRAVPERPRRAGGKDCHEPRHDGRPRQKPRSAWRTDRADSADPDHQGRPRQARDQGRPRQTRDQGRPRQARDQGRPRQARDQGRPRQTRDQGRPRQARDQGRPRQTRDQGRPRQTRDQGRPRQTRDQGRPRQARDQGRPRQARDQGRPRQLRHGGKSSGRSASGRAPTSTRSPSDWSRRFVCWPKASWRSPGDSRSSRPRPGPSSPGWIAASRGWRPKLTAPPVDAEPAGHDSNRQPARFTGPRTARDPRPGHQRLCSARGNGTPRAEQAAA